MDYAALRTLIETHPTHGSETDEALATWCNDPTAVTRNRATMPASELANVVFSQPAEYTAMTEAERNAFDVLTSVNEDVPIETGTEERTTLEAILGTNTKSELGSRQTEQVSRAVDAGINEKVRVGDIGVARTFGD